jgi:hypothetical protein
MEVDGQFSWTSFKVGYAFFLLGSILLYANEYSITDPSRRLRIDYLILLT